MTELDVPIARDWMVDRFLRLPPSMDLYEAIDRLVEAGAAAAPVVDDDGRLLGMLTEKDCLRILSNLTWGEGPGGSTVADFQSKVRTVLEPSMDLFRVAEVFLDTNFPVLPVVDGERLAGLISRQSLLRGIQALHRQLERDRERAERGAGRQAERPRGIENMQRVAGGATPEQLVRLFKRPARTV